MVVVVVLGVREPSGGEVRRSVQYTLWLLWTVTAAWLWLRL